MTVIDNNNNNNNNNKKPLTIGVFGGSFNPVHLGHALLAITTQQTKSVDQVVLVPVYRHAVKRDLLPFEDRVEMCRLAIQSFGDALSVNTIEQDVGASNGTMLRALKQQYPVGTKFLWICGDDFIRWMDKPKGIETLQEVNGLIVQRRLHKQEDNDNSNHHQGSSSAQNKFIQQPLDEAKLHRVAKQLNLEVDFIYGELPHFSSTLVRRAPGRWRSFLSQAVVQYLDERPQLLKQLIDNLEQEENEKNTNQESSLEHKDKKPKISGPHNNSHKHRSVYADTQLKIASACVLQGLDVVHCLQLERGRTGLHLSTGSFQTELQLAQAATDARLQKGNIVEQQELVLKDNTFEECLSLLAELRQVPQWLDRDRRILKAQSTDLSQRQGIHGWLARLSLVEKFNPRIDVLIAATVRALIEILQHRHAIQNDPQQQQQQQQHIHDQNNHHGTVNDPTNPDIPELLSRWCVGKEALGRLRAFVCSAGPEAPRLVQGSLKMRQRLNQMVDTKERELARVFALEAGLSSRLSAPDALHRMLQNVTQWEYKLMGCFSPNTPIALIHKFLEQQQQEQQQNSQGSSLDYNVEKFFEASTAAIDFLLTFAKALAASACATI